jgi:hypothetical protein
MKISQNIKIGITSKSGDNLFGNGLNQNVWFLFRLLKVAGYDIHLVSEDPKEQGKNLITEIIEPLSSDNIDTFGMIIECAHALSNSMTDLILDKGIVKIGIQYGNRLLIDLERMIHRPEQHGIFKKFVHEIWASPHFDFSFPALEIIEKTEMHVCPYIWSPEIITHAYMRFKIDPFFKHTTNINNIGFFEPNINVVKSCLIPMLIAEDLYRRRPELINEIYNFGSKPLLEKDNKVFKTIIKKLDIRKDKIVSFEGRYKFTWALHKEFAGTVVSHHWMNGLNYLQLEAMYLGTPMVHNSEFFKDHGYYYPEWDAKEGSRQLERAIETHKDVFLQERERDREKLWEFHPDNPKNIQGYVDLIENALAKHLRK